MPRRWRDINHSNVHNNIEVDIHKSENKHKNLQIEYYKQENQNLENKLKFHSLVILMITISLIGEVELEK